MSKLIDRLDRKFGRFGVPNVTPLIIAAQAVSLLAIQTNPRFIERLFLSGDSVLERGEYWRLFSFLMMPPTDSLIFVIFAWLIFYMMGTALEANWGAFRYNLYLFICYVATVAAALAAPENPVTNVYLFGSVFLAFAFLYPDFQLMIFFLIPVKVKWLAMIQWIAMFLRFANGNWTEKGLVLAATCNFFLFFAGDIRARLLDGKRRMDFQRKQLAQKDKPFHRCAVCGVTEKTNPRMDFRYCSKCDGDREYCDEHLRTHEHVVDEAPANAG